MSSAFDRVLEAKTRRSKLAVVGNQTLRMSMAGMTPQLHAKDTAPFVRAVCRTDDDVATYVIELMQALSMTPQQIHHVANMASRKADQMERG